MNFLNLAMLQNFSMSQTFSMFQKNKVKVWDVISELSEKQRFRNFFMSQTFSMFFFENRKVRDIENFCNIADFRKIKTKMTKSQHFSTLMFLDGHSYNQLTHHLSFLQH